MKICLCIVYPHEPHFYIVKLGYAVVISVLLIFAPKHRLWVLFRTTSAEIFQFLKLKKSLCIAWASFRNGVLLSFIEQYMYLLKT